MRDWVLKAGEKWHGFGDLAEGFNLDEHLRAIEADLVRRALEQSDGDRARACSLLGISARSLRYLLEKHRDVLSA